MGAKVEVKGPEDGKAAKSRVASFMEVYQFATAFDWFLMVCGFLASFTVGATQPIIMVLFADVMDAAGGVSGVGASLQNTFDRIAFSMLAVGAIAFTGGWVSQACFQMTGIRQSAAWRKHYLKSILRQDVSWYDTNNPEELSTKITESTNTYEQGINKNLMVRACFHCIRIHPENEMTLWLARTYTHTDTHRHL